MRWFNRPSHEGTDLTVADPGVLGRGPTIPLYRRTPLRAWGSPGRRLYDVRSIRAPVESRRAARCVGEPRARDVLTAPRGADEPLLARLVPFGVVEPQKIEERADLVVELGRMPHRGFSIDRIAIASTLTLSSDVPGLDEVGDDPLRSTLGDAHRIGDIAQSHGGTALQAQEDLRVAREKMPVLRFRT